MCVCVCACVRKLCVRKLCVCLCVRKLRVSELCVRVLCVCVSKLWREAAGGGKREERTGVHNQKQEPRTKTWGNLRAPPPLPYKTIH